MQTTKLLLAFLCANAPVSTAENGAPALRQSFDYHFSGLGGASIQHSAALQSRPVQRGYLQPGALQPSSSLRPISEEEWRKLFPRKIKK